MPASSKLSIASVSFSFKMQFRTGYRRKPSESASARRAGRLFTLSLEGPAPSGVGPAVDLRDDRERKIRQS
jgi:hypothetical protein